MVIVQDSKILLGIRGGSLRDRLGLVLRILGSQIIQNGSKLEYYKEINTLLSGDLYLTEGKKVE